MDPRNHLQNPMPTGTQPQEERPTGRRPPQMRKIDDMTEEEKRILKECERESFYYRALPASATTMVGAQYLVKTGRLAPHPKFGALPKTIIFGFFGYMLGKISYLPMCRQKILDQIPHSNLAATIRGEKSGNVQPNEGEMALSDDTSPYKPKEEYSAFNQTPSAFTESTNPSGIDDRFRPTIDKETKVENMPEEEPKSRTTYEDLRRRNRQQYEESQSKQAPMQPGSPSYKDSPLMPQKPWPDPRDKFSKPNAGSEPLDQTPPAPPSQVPSKRKRTNMWGDTIED